MARPTPTKGMTAASLAALVPTIDDRRAVAIRRQVEERPLRLAIPADLQPAYHAWRLRDLPVYIRVNSLPLVALVLLLTLLSTRFFGDALSGRDIGIWTAGSLLTCSLIIIGVLLAQFAAVQRYFDALVMVASTLLIAKYVAMPQLLQHPQAIAAESHFCTLALIVAILAVRQTVRHSLITCFAAAALGLAVANQWAPSGIDWRSLAYYFFAPACVCLFIGWMFEEQEKTGFLQALLILRATQEKEALNQTLSRLAHQDSLSGLANRREFDRRLASEWDRLKRDQKPLAALFIDIDHFKAYNDQYGHAAGDDALVAVGQTIRNALMRPADLAARYGGEEFVVLLPETDSSGASDVAQRIMAAVNNLAIPHTGSTTARHVTVSIGIATALPSTLDNSMALLTLADGALYAAKQNGRWQVQVAQETAA